MKIESEISVVVPTFNERKNVRELIQRIDRCLEGRSWEVIFVDDDSPDGTAEFVRQLARKDDRIRCLQRIGRRGLSSACIEGMLSTSSPYLAVMDGDLQHDETLLLQMLNTIIQENLDIVVGSRYLEGGGFGDWAESRIAISRFAARMSRMVVRTNLTDPMSGFFVINRKAFEEIVRNLSGIGFKILLDLFASSPRPLRVKELAYQFRRRHLGESKLDNQVAWEYGMLLLNKLFGKIIPIRFVAFSLVGGLGVFVHFLILTVLLHGLNIKFLWSQAFAALVTMTFNFTLNNILTYRDLRLKGLQWVRGWLSFTLACSVGAVANVGIAAYLFEKKTIWVFAAFAGIIVGAVWNYAVTMSYTWKRS